MYFSLITFAVWVNLYYFDVAGDLVGSPDAPFLEFDDPSFSGLFSKTYERIG